MRPIVSIIIPIIRPEKAERCIEAIKQNAGIPAHQYEIVTEHDKKRIGVTKMVARLVEKTKGEMVCFLGDDTIPQKDFLINALKAMKAMPDGWGMVSFNDNPNTTRSAAHWLCHKKLLPKLDGEFFHTGYQHCFCDDELLIRCQTMNRYIYAYDAVLYHEHPKVHKDVATDKDYDKIHGDMYDRDHALFQKRMANNWKTPKPKPPTPQRGYRVLVGIPSGDLVHAHFAMNLVNMVIKSISMGIQVGIVNPQFSLLQIARNEMVLAAKEYGATHLMTLDSDMTFPPETLLKLIGAGKDIVCCDAVRRRAPHTQVLTGMDGKPLVHPNPEDMTTETAPVEVMGGTSAVSLVKMSVFDKIKEPWFNVEWNGKSFLGEDYYFTNKARKAGISTYCDLILSPHIGHIGSKPYYLRDAEASEHK